MADYNSTCLVTVKWRIQNFPDGGGRGLAPAPEFGAETYYFLSKLHENERNWTERGALVTIRKKETIKSTRPWVTEGSRP